MNEKSLLLKTYILAFLMICISDADSKNNSCYDSDITFLNSSDFTSEPVWESKLFLKVGLLEETIHNMKTDNYIKSVQVKTTVVAESDATTAIGVDLGVKQFVTCSDGLVVAPVNSGKANISKLAKLQRNLARKVKFSNNKLRRCSAAFRWHQRCWRVENIGLPILGLF